MIDTDTDIVIEALQSPLAPDALRERGAAPFAFDVAGGPHLEFRFIEDLDALCICAPLGRLLGATRSEAGAGLMLGNLLLAEYGKSHYAVAPHCGTVYLCRTVQAWTQVAQAHPPLAELRGFVDTWSESRKALCSAAFID